jgi:hypothetical protein
MSKLIKGVILLSLVIFSLESFSQNYYNSPYTRFSIGDLINSGFATNRGMGGTSIALRSHNQVNYLNPASYTSQDTNSFLFQVGFAGRMANIQTLEDSDQSNNANIEYLAIGFPVNKWLNLSAGIVPYSRIQYAFTEFRPENPFEEASTFDYTGFGGFNEFYLGGALKIKEIVSLGVNFNYLFGSLDRKQAAYLSELESYSARIEREENFIASDFYSKIGLQLHPTIGKKHTLLLGFTLDAKARIKVKEKEKTFRHNTSSGRQYQDSLIFSLTQLSPLVLPNKFGVGIGYAYEEIFSASAEYSQQDWTGTEIAASSFSVGLYESYRVGFQYNPAPLSNRMRVGYYKRIQYRAGAYYTNTYLNHDGNSIPDWGVSVGFGLPIKNARKLFSGSMFNIGYQYGNRGTTDNGLIQEKYHIVTIGFTLHDYWFLKPKYD